MTDGPIAPKRAGITSWRHDTAGGGRSFTRGRAVTTAIGVAVTAASGLPMAALAADEPTTQSSVVELNPISVEDDSDAVNVKESADPRFTAPLLDTPKTVTVIPSKVLEERGITTLHDVFRTTPGISMGSGEGGTPNADRPLIRGSNAENSVLVDGIRDPGAQTRGTFNLEQVEVTKGADSAFSGRGGAGGSINLVTKTAKDHDFNRATATVGSDKTYGATLDSNFVINDTTAARINLMHTEGFTAGRDAVHNEADGAAATMSFGMGTGFRTILSYTHYEDHGIPDYGIPWIAGTGELADVDYDNFYGLADRDFQDSVTDSATARFEYDLAPGLVLSNTTRFTKTSLDYIATNPDDSKGNVANGYLYRAVKSRGSESKSWYNVTELSGEAQAWGMHHSFAMGVEVSKEDSSNAGYTVDTGSTTTCDASNVGAPSGYNCTDLYNPNPHDPWDGSISRSTSTTTGTVRTLSVYGFDTVELSPQWQANFGLRYDDFRVERESSGGRGGPYSGSDHSQYVTFQAGVVYKPAPNGSVYFNIGTAAEPSGVSNGEGGDNLSSDAEDLDPVITTSFELGTKWDVFGDRLSLTAAVFQNGTDNARETENGVTKNIGETRVRGVELGFAGRVTPKWEVFGGMTLLDAELVDDGDGSNDGNTLANTPQQSFSLWSTYDVSDRVTLGGGATYTGSQYGDEANIRKVPSYWVVDAMAAYKLTDNASLRLTVNNVADRRYIERSYSTHYATVGAGRSVTLSAALDF